MLKKTKAFTLIEILLVIAILAILSSISWINLANSKKATDVGNACSQVATYINKARNYTVSGNAKKATVSVSGKKIEIKITTNVGVIDYSSDSYEFKGNVSCSSSSFSYSAPSGIGSSGIVTCSSDGVPSRTITVTPYQAVCN
jgi:prepilin-type N-terminal cleavage/methylation domain-containing protein